MTADKPMLGVLEGFYGRPWSEASRLLMAWWLPAIGIDAYLYAPKADAYLRKAWQRSWPRSEREHLMAVGRRCAQSKLSFQVGLSPFELYLDYNRATQRALKTKVGEIRDLGVTGLAVLFDDMPGDLDSLAARQAEICADIRHWVSDTDMALRVCPSYYSDDPVLDEIFGQRPEGYVKSLYEQLDSAYEVFWTGPAVCSESISPADLEAVHRDCGGQVAIWDNYPVNDSRARSPHLYVQQLSGRSADIGDLIASHWCNAMNQPALSLPALSSLPALYSRLSELAPEALGEAGINDQLIDACRALGERRLDELSSEQRKELDSLATAESVAAQELRDWLSGGYEFDPECLTC
ncbi:beta-N-acetylglucosaminidase domain-containing protein [Congregibacter variabilis]|uniref:Beta-N-acetylglucosaminidase domain-containing protein n=1 Tax=Congregibacter variabilis TaxID=3081200 RepID=A0ABZ0I534_9GAMM|nr:beta-N-acetylglucosaminidase domain-containing protein [Congregibacter sp. IMCC43200]